MRDPLRLYLHYAGVAIRGQLQYRASTLMYAIGNLLLHAAEFLAIWALFDRFGSIRGWSFAEVALLYGMANMAFGLADTVAWGFDIFPQMVKSGDFDRLLLRPRSTAFQVAAQHVQVRRLGRFVQGAVVLAFAAAGLEVEWTFSRAALIAASVLGGACTFAGLFVLHGTLAFWTTESLEIMATVTYGGVETAQYPLAIYQRWFRRFFTFVVPLAFMNYVPALALTGRAEAGGYPAWSPWIAPLVGFAFLAACLSIWTFGVRHYRSTGS